MKTPLTLLLLTFLPLVGTLAQTVNYEKIIPPPYATQLSFADRLVQLAWQNHAANRNFELDVISTEKAIKLARFEWLDLISLNLNINTGSLQNFGKFTANEGENLFFPWYNMGISLSPSRFFTVPAEVELARFEHQKSQELLNAQKLRLRAEVLTRYEVYLHNLEMVKVITESYELANSNFVLARERFNKGDVTLDEFNAANATKIAALTGKMGAEMQFMLAKIALEEMIGMKLEEVSR
jgi:outer membrane protein TolC